MILFRLISHPLFLVGLITDNVLIDFECISMPSIKKMKGKKWVDCDEDLYEQGVRQCGVTISQDGDTKHSVRRQLDCEDQGVHWVCVIWYSHQ